MDYVDCVGRPLQVGDHVGVAFAYTASTGKIRIGRIESLEPFRVRWEADDNKISPNLWFDSKRVVLL